MKHKRIVSLLLTFCMMFSLVSTEAFAKEAPTIPAEGAVVYGDDVRVDYGGTAAVKYIVTVDPSAERISAFTPTYTYTADMTLASISASPASVSSQFPDVANHIMRFACTGFVGSTIKSEELTVNFSDVTATGKPDLSFAQSSALRAVFNGTSTKVDNSKIVYDLPAIIVQYPVTVNITDEKNSGGTVSAKTTAYDGRDTYDSNGAAMELASGDMFYVDSGEGQQNAPVLDLSVPDGYQAEVTVNSGSPAKYNGTAKAPLGIVSATTTVNVNFVKTSIDDFTLTYDANGGTNAPSPATYSDGTMATLAGAGNMTKSGYAFLGWSETKLADLSATADEPETITTVEMNADKIVYAVWGIDSNDDGSWDKHDKSYNLIFDLNGGTGSIANQSLKKGEHPTAVTEPTRTNYTFAGWKVTGSNPEEIIQTSGLTSYSMPAANTTLVAQWNEVGQYTVSFDTVTAPKPATGWPTSQTVSDGNTASSVSVPSIDGYTNDGKWYTDTTYTTAYNFSNPVKANITLYAKYEAKASVYTVSFQSVGVSKPAGWPSDQSVTAGGVATAPTVPAAAGYTNDGKWYTDAACTTEYNFSTPVTASITLYAMYRTINNYTVSFDTVTATKPAVGWPAPQIIADGNTASSASVPNIDGYTNDGKWYTDTTYTTAYDFSAPVTANITLYANYVKETAVYTVSFQSVGVAAPTTGWPANQRVEDGKNATAPAIPSVSGYTNDGKWYTDATCTTEYSFSTPVTANTILYTKYVPISKYTVSFDTVTATKPTTGWPVAQTVDSGNTATSQTVPAISGYVTDGSWYTDTTYTTVYNFATPVTANITLYAKYEREAAVYTVSFQPVGTSKPADWPADQKVTEGGKVAGVTVPVIDGYTNDGKWYTDAACTTAYDFNASVTANITLYANYKEIIPGSYTVTFDTVTATKPATGWPAAQTVTEGNTATSVEVPTIEGFASDGKWYTDTTYTTAFDFTSPVKANMTLYAKYTATTGNDPIRAVDTTDPSNANPSNPNGYLVPGLNGLDENGAGDDQVITPKPGPDGKDDSSIQNGTLVLPDGGSDAKDNTYAPEVLDNKGTVVAYVVFVELKDKDDTTKTLAPMGSFESMQLVPAGTDFNTYVPAVAGYKYDSADKLPLTSAEMANATSRNVVTLYYTVVLNTGDPIRPFEKGEPDNHNPAKPDGFLVPGPNGADENGNNDDIVITPNATSDTKDPAKIMESTGNLYLPDGGKDSNDTNIPPCVIDRNGNVVAYLLKVNLVDKNTKAELTAKTMDEPLVFMVDVNANQSGCTLTIPQVKENGYTYDSAEMNGKALTSLTIPTATLSAATSKAEATVTLYYTKETVDITITLVGPTGDSAFTAAAVSALKGYTAVSGTTNQASTVIKASIGDVISAPALSGYNAVTPSSFTLAEGQTKLVFNYTKIVIPSGGGGGGGGVTNYALTFETNGGSSLPAVTKTSGSRIDLAQYVPTKPGNTFQGWFSDAALTTAVTTVTLNKNTTVYAKWSGLTNDHIAYLVGYNDGTFKPDKNMTRAEAAVMFYRLLTDKTATTNVTFPDVANGAWYGEAVRVLASQGIITGFTDGKFRPYNNITRAQFAAIASRFENLTSSDKSFSDVPTTYWAYRYINSAATKGWINGYSDGTFRPNQFITRAQVVTMVNNVLARVADQSFIAAHATNIRTFADVSNSYWAYWAIEEAANAHNYTRATDTSTETWTTLK